MPGGLYEPLDLDHVETEDPGGQLRSHALGHVDNGSVDAGRSRCHQLILGCDDLGPFGLDGRQAPAGFSWAPAS